MSKRTARIELRPVEGSTKARQPHYLRLVASNGQVLATSETYSTRYNARVAVDAWVEAFFQVGGGDDPDCRPVPHVEFDADGNVP